LANLSVAFLVKLTYNLIDLFWINKSYMMLNSSELYQGRRTLLFTKHTHTL